MNITSSSASFRLDDGREFSFKIDLNGNSLTLTMGDQEQPCVDGDALIARVEEAAGPNAGTEADDVHNLVCHLLTCLDYFSSPENDR